LNDKTTSLEQKDGTDLIEILENDYILGEIPIENAGIVIGAAYFEKLFTMLKFTEDKKFNDNASIQKALKILYYFARQNSDCWEHELTLNKIICGLDINYPYTTNTEITNEEKNTVDSLTAAIIKNWPVMKNTTPEGFREYFLQRKGFLTKNDDGWVLSVDRKSFDMLIDTLPWSFSMIKLPWMMGVLRVEWKAP
jgi:hypothetical protein